MLSFGGDHFVTLPLLRAHAKHFGKMALVHFDAHTDTYANGCEFDHGTMFYTAPKEGLIDPNHSVQIGIRTEFDKDNGFTVLDACQVNDRSVDDVIAQVKQIVGDMPVYLTFDIDCLDPAFAPGTGTPVIGGLTSDRAIKLVRGLKDLNIVGMDVVEVAPAYDQSEITALAAATLALEMLYIQAAKRASKHQMRCARVKRAINVGCGVNALSDLRSAPVGRIRCASIASGNAHKVTNVPFMSDAA